MEVDTGASASIISENTYIKIGGGGGGRNILLSQKTAVKLCTYTGEELNICGCITVDITYHDQTENLPLLVVGGEGPSFIGRDWLKEIRLDWGNLCKIQSHPSKLQTVLDKQEVIFCDELGLVKDTTAKIHVDETKQPRFRRPHVVPYAL